MGYHAVVTIYVNILVRYPHRLTNYILIPFEFAGIGPWTTRYAMSDAYSTTKGVYGHLPLALAAMLGNRTQNNEYNLVTSFPSASFALLLDSLETMLTAGVPDPKLYELPLLNLEQSLEGLSFKSNIDFDTNAKTALHDALQRFLRQTSPDTKSGTLGQDICTTQSLLTDREWASHVTQVATHMLPDVIQTSIWPTVAAWIGGGHATASTVMEQLVFKDERGVDLEWYINAMDTTTALDPFDATKWESASTIGTILTPLLMPCTSIVGYEVRKITNGFIPTPDLGPTAHLAKRPLLW
jgi:hypothetical protein